MIKRKFSDPLYELSALKGIGDWLGLFGRKAKCFSCGGTYEIRKCECGRFYCAAHGFDGKCFECQTDSIGITVKPLSYIEDTSQTGKVERPTDELIPRLNHAYLKHDISDVGLVKENLIEDLEKYKPSFFGIIAVDTNREIRIYYQIQYVESRIILDARKLELIMDLEKVPKRLFDKNTRIWIRYVDENPLKDERFTNLLRLLNKEIFFICELVVRSLGAVIQEVNDQLDVENFSPRILGICPSCGAISRGLVKCHICGKEVPEEMEFRRFLKIYVRRRYMDRLIALRASKMRDELKKDLITMVKSRLATLEEM